MYIRKNKSRGKLYYQIVDEKLNKETGKRELSMIAHLGTIEKILSIFSFYKNYKGTDSKDIQLVNPKSSESIVPGNLTENTINT